MVFEDGCVKNAPKGSPRRAGQARLIHHSVTGLCAAEVKERAQQGQGAAALTRGKNKLIFKIGSNFNVLNGRIGF